MKIGIRASTAAIGVLIWSPVAASASEAGPLGDMLAFASAARHADGAAAGTIDSFRMRYFHKGRTLDTSIVDVAHDAVQVSVTGDDGRTRRDYIVRNIWYTRGAGGSWKRVDLTRPSVVAAANGKARPPGSARHASRSRDVSTKLPDRRVDGTLFTAYRFRWQSETSRSPVTCLFEKTSGYMRRCHADDGSYTLMLDRYNDPSNVVAVPAAALHAPEVATPWR